MDTFVATKKRVPVKLNNPLAHSFGFDFGDLQDNRTGFISHWQKKRLRWYLLSYTISILTWIGLLTIPPLALSSGNSFLLTIATLWVASVLMVFGLLWLWQIRSVWLDVQRGKVKNIISDVRHVRQMRKNRVRLGMSVREHNDIDYFITIGKERFIASREQMLSFREGLLYTIYVAPESRQILSAEPYQKDDEDAETIAFLFDDIASEDQDHLMEMDSAQRKRRALR